MKKDNKKQIFLVDDDAVFLKLLEIKFKDFEDFQIEIFSTGELCIAAMSSYPDIVILDYHLDGIEKGAMNGLDTLDKIKSINADTAVIMLSSQDKIDVAINCMHHQAFDYVVKSETAFIRLQKAINYIFNIKKMQKELNWYMDHT